MSTRGREPQQISDLVWYTVLVAKVEGVADGAFALADTLNAEKCETQIHKNLRNIAGVKRTSTVSRCGKVEISSTVLRF